MQRQGSTAAEATETGFEIPVPELRTAARLRIAVPTGFTLTGMLTLLSLAALTVPLAGFPAVSLPAALYWLLGMLATVSGSAALTLNRMYRELPAAIRQRISNGMRDHARLFPVRRIEDADLRRPGVLTVAMTDGIRTTEWYVELDADTAKIAKK